MFVYVEYRERLPGVELARFHSIVGRTEGTWSDDNPDDVTLLNIARTWRIGPEPEYLSVSYSPNFGLERLADWDNIVRSGAEDQRVAQSRSVSRIRRAGCYSALRAPIVGRTGPYYVEFWDKASGRSRDDVVAEYERRALAHSDLTLHLLADAFGRLAPRPGGLAVWGLPNSAALADVAEEVVDGACAVRLVDAGLYANIGDEVL